MTETGDSRKDILVSRTVGTLSPSRSALPGCILSGESTEIVELYDGDLFAFPSVLGTRPNERVFPVGPRLVAIATPGAFRLTHLEKGTIFAHELPDRAGVRAVSALFNGTALGAVIDGPQPEVWLTGIDGQRLSRAPVPRPTVVAFAEDRGLVVVGSGQTLCAVDLRNGAREWAQTPFPIDSLDICARGRDLVLAHHARPRARTWHVPYSSIFEPQ